MKIPVTANFRFRHIYMESKTLSNSKLVLI